MRLKERALVAVEIAPRVCVTGAFGSKTEAFGEKVMVRASVLPDAGSFSQGKSGMESGDGIRIIIPKDVSVSEGDGVFINGEAFVVSSVNKWRAHAELACAKKL